MRIYISGKISDLHEALAASYFRNAETIIIDAGHEPHNPMAHETPGLSWAAYMAEDIEIIMKCDAMYMLWNWRDSRGARIEHAVAEILEKPIYYEASRLMSAFVDAIPYESNS